MLAEKESKKEAIDEAKAAKLAGKEAKKKASDEAKAAKLAEKEAKKVAKNTMKAKKTMIDHTGAFRSIQDASSLRMPCWGNKNAL
jgi:cell division protein FtsN